MKKQILIIGGGDTFETYEEYINFLKNFEIDLNRFSTNKSDWKPWLREVLVDNFEVFIPTMPNKTNAQYEEWKIWIEKILEKLDGEIILIGHSLGGAFLAKYLSENSISNKIKSVFLVAAVYDQDTDGYPLASFSLPEKLKFPTDNIFLYHSEDDPVVPFSDLDKFKQALPTAKTRALKGMGHINQEEFPEIKEDIMSLYDF